MIGDRLEIDLVAQLGQQPVEIDRDNLFDVGGYRITLSMALRIPLEAHPAVREPRREPQ